MAFGSITRPEDEQMAGATVLSGANNQHRLTDERVEGVGDRHRNRQTPGTMNSL